MSAHDTNWLGKVGSEALLMKLWRQGLTAKAIGERLGCSKSAVVGKVARLKLPARRAGANPLQLAERYRDAQHRADALRAETYPQRTPARVKQPHGGLIAGVAPTPTGDSGGGLALKIYYGRKHDTDAAWVDKPQDPDAPVSLEVPLQDITDAQCKYIHGSATKALMCGHQVALGHSWCPYHCKLIYEPKVTKPS